jgi:hypothetical protein
MFYGRVAAEEAVSRIKAADPDGPQRAYRCEKCSTWHITRESGAQRKHRGDWLAKKAESMQARRYW